MRRPKRFAIGLLLAALVLAVGTPVYVALTVPDLSVYLLHPMILVGQGVPYALCAGLWLPWRTGVTATTALIFAALLFFSAVVLYLPMLWSPGAHRGDMIGFAFILITLVTTAALLVGSALAGLGLWFSASRHRGGGRAML
jgi:hypothetical protein